MTKDCGKNEKRSQDLEDTRRRKELEIVTGNVE